MTRLRAWEQMGAASGVLSTAMFAAAFAVFLTTSPAGSPALPSVQDAQLAPAFLAAHLTAVRLVALFVMLGIVLFGWFTASLWAVLREAEGVPARGAAAVLVGAAAGAALMLAGLTMSFTAGLSASPAQVQVVPTLYVAAALLFALGGGVLSLFFFGAARAILGTGVLGRWLGVLAFIAGLLCVLTFLAPFFATGPLNAATGAFGFWVWLCALVLWMFLASLAMVLRQRQLPVPAERLGRAREPAGHGRGQEGAVR